MHFTGAQVSWQLEHKLSIDGCCPVGHESTHLFPIVVSGRSCANLPNFIILYQSIIYFLYYILPALREIP